jgi:signal transduction histidine kinase
VDRAQIACYKVLGVDARWRPVSEQAGTGSSLRWQVVPRKLVEQPKRIFWRRGPAKGLRVRILLGTAALILLSEALAMAVVEIVWPGGFWEKTILDEAILVFVTLPGLYFAIFRPLLRLLAERKQSEEALALRAREMAARNAVSTAAASEVRPELMFSKVIDVVLSVFGADGGWVLLLGPEPESAAQVLGLRGVPPSLVPAGSAKLYLDSRTCCGGLLDLMPPGEITLVSECSHLPREVLMAAGFGGYVGVPLPAGHRVRAILNLVWKTPRTLDDGDRALLRAIARNVAIAAESAALHEAELRARRAAEMVSSATLALNQTLELDAVLQTLFDHLRRLVPYDRAKVMLLEGGSRLEVQAVFSPSGSTETAGKMPSSFDAVQNPLVSEVLETRRSVCVADMSVQKGASARTHLEAERSWLGVPLLAEGRAIGLFTLVKGEPGFFRPEQVKLVEAIAAPASVAIANARLFGEVHSGRKRLETVSRKLVEVQETERRHLAHELHDEIGQSLTAILYRLAAVSSSRTPRNGVLDEAIEITKGTMQSVRNMSLDLRPSLLDEAGLSETLRWYIDRQVRSETLEVGLSVSPELRDLPLDVRNACFRIVQEALTNVVRHSGARRAGVQLRSAGSRIEVAVWDDGRGFDVGEAYRRARTGGSLGILGMQERAELLGGELVFESSPGAGTTVKASVPLTESD